MTMVGHWLESLGARARRGATDEQLDAAEKGLGVTLPDDYRSLMHRSDGGEAGFGHSWVRVWPIQDLVEHNDGYLVPPGFTYFGTNGGGEAYAWDWRRQRRALYVVMAFIDSDSPASAVPCGNTLEEFFATLYAGIPFGA
jgi:SMI1/KNR4 family protein SUKH-1